jgi:HAMP domain-containing protein
VPPQSEFVAHPTQEPNRQTEVGALQFALERQATQVPVLLQYWVAPEQAVGQ